MRVENEVQAPPKTSKRETLAEGLDFYFDNGLMVLTARFLRKRGYCCGNDCRHCPYEGSEFCKSE
jgi:hypothetical protein